MPWEHAAKRSAHRSASQIHNPLHSIHATDAHTAPKIHDKRKITKPLTIYTDPELEASTIKDKEGDSTTLRMRVKSTISTINNTNDNDTEIDGYTTALPTEGRMATRRRSREEAHMDIKKLKSNMSGATR